MTQASRLKQFNACYLAVQAQAVALHVTMPELTTLIGALDRLDDYQNRAKECLR